MGFKIVPICQGIWQFQDSFGCCATLVTGDRRALLFDTMLGLGDLRGEVEKLTDLPLMVMNSHGHFDHVGGNWQFQKVYISGEDKAMAADILEKFPPELNIKGFDLKNCVKSLQEIGKAEEIRPGERIDLGGLHAKTLALPGHTAGSLGLLLEERRLLLAGDACSPQMCLFMDGAQSLKTYSSTLYMLEGEPFDNFLLGHFTELFPKSWLEKFKACTELPGKKRGVEFAYPPIPSYRGTAYILEPYNDKAGGAVCIITGEAT